MRGYKLPAWKQMRWKYFTFFSLLRKVYVFIDTAWTFLHFQLQSHYYLTLTHSLKSKIPLPSYDADCDYCQSPTVTSVTVTRDRDKKVMKMAWSLEFIN